MPKSLLSLYFFLLLYSLGAAQPSNQQTDRLDKILKQASELVQTSPDSAVSLLKICSTESYRSKAWSQYAAANKILGMIMSEQGRFTEASIHADSAFRYFTKTGNQFGISECLNLQGNILMLEGQNELALQNYLNCIALAEKTKNNALLLICYSNTSLMYNRLKQFDLSLRYARKQYNLAVSLNDWDEIGYGCAPIIDVFGELRQVDSMEKYVQIFGNAIRNTTDPYLPAILANVTGAMYDRKKDYPQAIAWFQKAVKLNTELNDKDAVCQSLNNLGSSYFLKNDYSKAKETLEKALKSSAEANNLNQQKIACLNLAETFEALRDFENAYQYRVKYQRFSDSALNESSQQTIQQLEARYQFDKKETAIRLLSQENALQASIVETKQTERNLILISSLALLGFVLFFGNRYILRRKLANEKAILSDRLRISQDLHDEVGSSLSSIQIYSKVADKLMEEDPEKTHRILEQISENSQISINNLGDIVWAMKEDVDEYSMETRIKNYCFDLLEPKEIEVEYSFEIPLNEIFRTAEQRKNALLLVKEAIHNMAKYSGATQVKIGFGRIADAYELWIEDNGKGFDPQTVRKGNGLETMQKRAQTLGGTLFIESQKGIGTKIKFHAPD